jgi:hypothetical protein
MLIDRWTNWSWFRSFPSRIWEPTLNWYVHSSPVSNIQLEYDGIEGMILLSELSRRRIRSVQKLIKVGRNEVVVVMRVDPDKGE